MRAIFHKELILSFFGFIFVKSFWLEKAKKVGSFFCQQSGPNLAGCLASKLASKNMAYKWFWGHFPGNSCQRLSQQEAGKAPATRPQIKNKNIEKEQQQLSAAPAAAAFFRKLHKHFQELPEREHEAALFYKRSKKQPEEYVKAGFVKCVENRKGELQVDSELVGLCDFGKNKKLADKDREGLPMRFRTDIFEVLRRSVKKFSRYMEGYPLFDFCCLFLPRIELLMKGKRLILKLKAKSSSRVACQGFKLLKQFSFSKKIGFQ